MKTIAMVVVGFCILVGCASASDESVDVESTPMLRNQGGVTPCGDKFCSPNHYCCNSVESLCVRLGQNCGF